MNRSLYDLLDGTQPCQYVPEQVFFPGHGGRDTSQRAKAICRSCDFHTACLQYALVHDVAGIWGATTYRERATYRRARGIKPIPVQIPSALTGVRPNQKATT